MTITFANLPDGLQSMALFDQAFAAVPYTPQGNISSNTVQGAITELDTEKAAISSLASVALSGASVDLIGTLNTWTPVLTAAVPGDLAVSYTTQLGRYVYLSKNVVFVSVNITTSSFTYTTATGVVNITGLPFTSQSIGIAYRGGLQMGGWTKAGYTSVTLGLGSNSSSLAVNVSGSGVVQASMQITDLPSAGTVVINGSITALVQ